MAISLSVRKIILLLTKLSMRRQFYTGIRRRKQFRGNEVCNHSLMKGQEMPPIVGLKLAREKDHLRF